MRGAIAARAADRLAESVARRAARPRILATMRFGLTLPHYGFSLPDDEPITFECDGRPGRAGREELGFDSVWVSDHFFYSFGRYGAERRRRSRRSSR